MTKAVTLGGDRLGSGNKMKEYLHGYGRSSHDIGCIIATDQAAGTLVPYFCDVATNGTTYYIDMATKVRTNPTNGPLFGTFKHQLDWFSIPIRLYIGALHNNALGIGLKMSQIKLPKMDIPIWTGNNFKISKDGLLAYTGIRKLGNIQGPSQNIAGFRRMPAIFKLAYWDIYKNYYANKQEEIGYTIGKPTVKVNYVGLGPTEGTPVSEATYEDGTSSNWSKGLTASELRNYQVTAVSFQKMNEEEVRQLTLNVGDGTQQINFKDTQTWDVINIDLDPNNSGLNWIIKPKEGKTWPEGTLIGIGYAAINDRSAEGISLMPFELKNIDEMRESILQTPKTVEFIVNSSSPAPYNVDLMPNNKNPTYQFSQIGLGVKTYLSDRFNNWLSTEWIDGSTTGINEITSVDVSDGKLSMDELILSKKLFNMLNRIAISGGSYNDWQEAVYGVSTIRMAESPMYCGGMSSEVTFDEVVANSGYENSAGEQALGSLAGRGTDRATKGGKALKIRIEEPSVIMCIGSITPRIFYSQGNKWWNRLKTMDDLHKPELDQIGFQELLTEEFAGFDTKVTINQANQVGTEEYHSVGKQPSWIEYMTNVNQSFGGFAADGPLEWMVLNRKYAGENYGTVIDATTYIDPTIYNVAFADTTLEAKNFWVQVAFDVTARRKMSAKQIPNL